MSERFNSEDWTFLQSLIIVHSIYSYLIKGQTHLIINVGTNFNTIRIHQQELNKYNYLHSRFALWKSYTKEYDKLIVLSLWADIPSTN